MPLYDYGCESCGHALEVMHGVNGSGPDICERCGGRMRKLLSTPAIVFKGSGWAKKDRSATASPGRARTSKPADDAGSGSDTGGSNGTAEASTSATASATAATSSGDGGD